MCKLNGHIMSGDGLKRVCVDETFWHPFDLPPDSDALWAELLRSQAPDVSVASSHMPAEEEPLQRLNVAKLAYIQKRMEDAEGTLM